jgi:hypothetical protein
MADGVGPEGENAGHKPLAIRYMLLWLKCDRILGNTRGSVNLNARHFPQPAGGAIFGGARTQMRGDVGATPGIFLKFAR